MMKKACIIVMAGLFLSLPVNLMGEEKSGVELAGMRIVGSGYGLNGTELRAFHQKSGTSLALVVRAPKNKKIVEVDDSNCSLEKFTDDRGLNLLDDVDWGGFPKISKSGNLALVEVSSPKRPSKGASRVIAQGTIQLRVAASEKTEKIENIKPEVGVKAKVGQEVIEVIKVQQENDSLIFILKINRKFVDNMKEIRFYTPKGDLIDILGRGSFTFGNVSQVEYNLNTKSLPESLTVAIDLFQELETLNISFEIETGLGF